MIPNKCKYCPYLDYDEGDDGDKRVYTPICTKEGGCKDNEEE